METRTHRWETDHVDGPDGHAWAVLEPVDVGDVRIRVGLARNGDMGSPGAGPWAVVGPLLPDDVEELAAVLLAAASHARRWSELTAR